MDQLLTGLRAAAEPTRLRILTLCLCGELTASELTRILGQSQPRVSRHLKLLCEAGLLDRVQEGTWAFFHIPPTGRGAELVRTLVDQVSQDDTTVARDLQWLEVIKEERAERANSYFSKNAESWNRIRTLHVDEAEVEQALVEMLPPERAKRLLDIGTGTGRILQLLEGHAKHGLGIDSSREMLAVARANLADLRYAHYTLRQADMYQLPVSEGSFDLIVLHMVLHFSDRPAEVIAEAARALASGGHFLIVDFAPHSMEELRNEHAHRRLGFARDEVESWCRDNDLDVTEVRDLEGDPLTVSIWKSRRPAAVVRSRQPSAAQDAAQGTERTMAHPSQHISDNISVSFEFFPPKTAEAESALWDTVCRLAPLQPAFVSVTYGAGGTMREHTHATVTRIARETALTPAAHLTCVDATRGEVDDIARQYWDTGIRHLVALRGDPPDGAGSYSPATGGYAYASDLVAGLCKVADFEISVAAYPEVHPDAPSPTFDFDNLKRKIDAGASRAITQFFFDNSAYLRFRDAVAAAGIDAPLVPGIMPVTNFSGILRFAERCGASIPARLANAFDGLDNDAYGRRRIAEEIACDQCLDLAEHGVCEFHFYTLNRAELTASICQRLGVVTTEAPLSKKLEAAR